jgi:transposase
VTAACRKVGGELGIKADTLRGWAKQAQIDRGMRPGASMADAARIRALERENAELRRVNAILRTASASRAQDAAERPRGLPGMLRAFVAFRAGAGERSRERLVCRPRLSGSAFRGLCHCGRIGCPGNQGAGKSGGLICVVGALPLLTA